MIKSTLMENDNLIRKVVGYLRSIIPHHKKKEIIKTTPMIGATTVNSSRPAPTCQIRGARLKESSIIDR